MRQHDGAMTVEVQVYPQQPLVKAEELLGEERIEALEEHLAESTREWLSTNVGANEPVLTADAEVR